MHFTKPSALKTSNDTNKIDADEVDYLYKSQSQIPDSGMGLFTAIDIFEDEIIAVFKGEILTATQANKRAAEGNNKYFIILLDGSILDSMHAKCFAKYANDALGSKNTSFKNNTRITLDDDNNVCIEATRKIIAGEELFCSYGKSYWKMHG